MIDLQYIFIGVGGGFVLLTLILSIYLIYKHLLNYTQPKHQRCIVRILFIVPLYALYSLLSLIFPDQQTYFAVLRDCYEAYALYMFFVLCIEYGGGQLQTEASWIQQAPTKLVFPLNCVTVQPSAKLLKLCRQGILQYALIRPLITLASAILLIVGKYEEGNWSLKNGYLYATIVNNIGVTIALYFLVEFYKLAREDLKPYRPILKFGVIKGIVFFCYWQSIILLGLVQFKFLPSLNNWPRNRTAAMLQNLAICFEMFVFAILFIYAFPYEMYRIGAMSQAPLIHEIQLGGNIKGSLTDTVNQKDMVQDTYDSFVPKRKHKSKNFKKVYSDDDLPVPQSPYDEEGKQEHSDDAVIELDILDDSRFQPVGNR